MVSRPSLIPQILVHVGPFALADWLLHFLVSTHTPRRPALLQPQPVVGLQLVITNSSAAAASSATLTLVPRPPRSFSGFTRWRPRQRPPCWARYSRRGPWAASASAGGAHPPLHWWSADGSRAKHSFHALQPRRHNQRISLRWDEMSMGSSFAALFLH
jgi:hypothetical protein